MGVVDEVWVWWMSVGVVDEVWVWWMKRGCGG